MLVWSARTPNAAAPRVADEPVTLSPFQVVGDPNDTYEATNTNSITGTSTSLNRTPLDARIFSRTMMDELDIKPGVLFQNQMPVSRASIIKRCIGHRCEGRF